MEKQRENRVWPWPLDLWFSPWILALALLLTMLSQQEARWRWEKEEKHTYLPSTFSFLCKSALQGLMRGSWWNLLTNTTLTAEKPDSAPLFYSSTLNSTPLNACEWRYFLKHPVLSSVWCLYCTWPSFIQAAGATEQKAASSVGRGLQERVAEESLLENSNPREAVISEW